MAHRDGFTLLEIVVALLIGSLVLLGAHALLAAVEDQVRLFADASAEADLVANGQEQLRAIVGRLDIGAPETRPFYGDAQRVSFSSWCDVPSGWLERCNVTLAFDSTGANRRLVVHWASDTVILVRGFGHGAFRYLTSAADGGHWVKEWGASVTAPLGVGAILQYSAHTDTLILRIGPRG